MSVSLVIKVIKPVNDSIPAEFPVDIDRIATVAELKAQISGRVGLDKEDIRLVSAGRIWQDAATVASYEPQHNSFVHCLNNPQRVARATTAQTLTPANPMQHMMGGGLLPPTSGAGTQDPMQQMMSQAQQQMMQNPEMMQQLMNSPIVQQIMGNPETMRAMIRMNPQLNQLMEERPEIARMLEDPAVLQQSMEMMRNPALMREMTRNADRALGNLDVMPGGHNALVRAHEEFADPIFAALSGSNGEVIAANAQAYAEQTEGAPNNEALPNPWGGASAQPATPTVTTAPSAMPGMNAPAPPSNPMSAMMQQMMNDPAQMQQALALSQSMFGGTVTDTQSTTVPTPAADPMATMMQQMTNDPARMQQMMSSSPQLFGDGTAAGLGQMPNSQTRQGNGPSANPMNGMLQQMVNNPALMQQSLAMAQQIFGGGSFATSPGQMVTPAMAPNPIAGMMQQMLQDPARMQQSMAMTQQLFGGADTGGAASAPAASPMADALLSAQRARFASQLSQLVAMGFTNEVVCLRALAQHNGRVDAAIDSLLASGESSA